MKLRSLLGRQNRHHCVLKKENQFLELMFKIKNAEKYCLRRKRVGKRQKKLQKLSLLGLQKSRALP